MIPEGRCGYELPFSMRSSFPWAVSRTMSRRNVLAVKFQPDQFAFAFS